MIVAERQVECNHVRRAPQTPRVPIEEKEPLVVRAQRLVHALAVQKAMIEHGDDCLALVGDSSVHEYDRCHLLLTSALRSLIPNPRSLIPDPRLIVVHSAQACAFLPPRKCARPTGSQSKTSAFHRSC